MSANRQKSIIIPPLHFFQNALLDGLLETPGTVKELQFQSLLRSCVSWLVELTSILCLRSGDNGAGL